MDVIPDESATASDREQLLSAAVALAQGNNAAGSRCDPMGSHGSLLSAHSVCASQADERPINHVGISDECMCMHKQAGGACCRGAGRAGAAQ